MSSKPKTVPELLECMAAVIEERGWTRGFLANRGRVCLVGALNVALYGTPDGWPDKGTLFDPMVNGAYKALSDGPFEGRSLVEFNDEAARSRAHVLAALRETAAALRDAA